MTVEEDNQQTTKRFCLCGCGEIITKEHDKQGREQHFNYGHFKRVKDLTVECGCGCGELIKKFDTHGADRVVRQFKHGHNQTQERHWQWHGGRKLNHAGYVMIQVRGHPRAKTSNGYYVFEHDWVMEQHIGRYLLPGEVVHHKNGVKTDNRIENLELFVNHSEHLKVDKKKDMSNRRCCDCGSDKTYITKPLKPTHSFHERWFKGEQEGTFRCDKCHENVRRLKKKSQQSITQ